jgi:hypothetical protein
LTEKGGALCLGKAPVSDLVFGPLGVSSGKLLLGDLVCGDFFLSRTNPGTTSRFFLNPGLGSSKVKLLSSSAKTSTLSPAGLSLESLRRSR